MINWLKILFNKKDKQLLTATNIDNKYYIDKYKDFDKLIATKYQQKDASGKIVDIDGIVSPLKIDNRQLCSVTDYQGNKPHCGGYSICNIAEALIWKKTGKLINLNADQVYAKAKQLDGQSDVEGTYLEFAIKAAIDLGGFGDKTDNLKIGFLYNNQDIEAQIKRLIHKYDFLHAGFAIDDGWYNATNDNYIIQQGTRQLGGHAILLCGYDSIGVYIQNSWSKNWGSNGFAILPWNLVRQQLIYCCFIDGFII